MKDILNRLDTGLDSTLEQLLMYFNIIKHNSKNINTLKMRSTFELHVYELHLQSFDIVSE